MLQGAELLSESWRLEDERWAAGLASVKTVGRAWARDQAQNSLASDDIRLRRRLSSPEQGLCWLHAAPLASEP